MSSNGEEEEDGYMSLEILQEAQDFESKRKESSYTERRKRELREQEKKGYIKPRAQLEQEEREKGLNNTLVDNEDNKGMKMLMKMGFKKGMTLGNKSDAIAEPIKVDLKSGRQGLGMDSLLKKRAREEEEKELESRKKLDIDPEDYRVIMAQKAKEAQYFRYINAAVSICEKLDESADIKTNILWTLKTSVAEEEEQQEVYPKEQVEKLQSLNIEQQLDKLTSYLRDTYFYCFWCRAKYENKEDLDTNCPGRDEDDH
jgi:hypothetical protein